MGTLGLVVGVDVVVVWLGVAGTWTLVISQSSHRWTTLPESLQ